MIAGYGNTKDIEIFLFSRDLADAVCDMIWVQKMWIYEHLFVSDLWDLCVSEQKLTAIVSLDRGHCFVLPLNSTFVAPLREYYQLVRNIEVCVYIFYYVISSVCNVISLLILQHLFCEPKL